ncbi:DEAD/DEAH box helicase [Photobacterium sanguinicancri]|uniref:ATP-dependent helicase n=1 Tax=Photobacterium sanguinicancri TaxID=875932 RepID=A0AAW7YA33_9GAMM|nr:DEAD/DEAH box helicase [Photobacterium sanguinicancri]KXI21473.1 RNA helicase [Photobacterium sanguinicancri]MDO6545197.1 DEAD/DEAH box helicase [Photobacterium sanguinicancri]OZS41951.1 ATP-dependent helicase [Photobacterium sanguinicancri]
MHFKDLGLDQRLLKKINDLGFDQATEIQQQAIPIAMLGKDLLASSKTGSGKTLAFLLPAMQRMYRSKPFTRRDPRVLILTPTRELAKQVFAQLRTLNAGTPYDGTLIVGGENFNDQVKALRDDPMFVVATPGRLADHLEHKSTYLDGLEMLILDEADRMLDLGFEAHLRSIHNAANHRRRQTLMFSATLDHNDVLDIATDMLDAPKQLAVGSSAEEHKDITQRFMLCDHLDHKQALLDKILETEDYKQVIIFTATRVDTERLTKELNERQLKAVALSGDLNQTQRNSIMSQFERVCHKILVTTDVASRGLDIDNVSHVINFDMPKHAEEYVHRVGRTGRAGNKGDAISLVGPKDWRSFKNVEAYLQQDISFTTMEGLEGKFKGLKPAPKKKFVKKKTTNKPEAAKKSTAPKAKKKVDKRFYDNVAVGDNVFMPKKRKPANPSSED